MAAGDERRAGRPSAGRAAPGAVWRRWAVVLAAVLVLLACAALPACGGDASGGSPGGGQSGGGQPSGGPQPGGGQAGGTTSSPTSAPQPASSAAGGGAGDGDGASAVAGAGSATEVVFVDVGQGDASVVRSGAWAGLIDGGPPGSEAAVARALERLKVRRLDAVVVSHMHEDHTGGLPAVVRRFRPRTAYVAGAVDPRLRRAFARAGTRVVQVRRGRTLPAWGSARARVLSPGRLSHDEVNENSVVILLRAAGSRFLFTGDSTGEAEERVGRLLAGGPPVTVLKVAHHGSEYSTSSTFLAGVRARTAVISVGPNDYGHPTRETLARLRRSRVAVLTTWKNGTITFTVSKTGELRRSCTRSSTPVRGFADARGKSGG